MGRVVTGDRMEPAARVITTPRGFTGTAPYRCRAGPSRTTAPGDVRIRKKRMTSA